MSSPHTPDVRQLLNTRFRQRLKPCNINTPTPLPFPRFYGFLKPGTDLSFIHTFHFFPHLRNENNILAQHGRF